MSRSLPDQVRVAPTWARVLLSALAAGAVGAGGPIELAPDAHAATAAAYFVRFSAFRPSLADASSSSGHSGRQCHLRQGGAPLPRGSARVRILGGRVSPALQGRALLMEPGARARLIGPAPFGPTLRQRYRHARILGASQVVFHGQRRLRLLPLARTVRLDCPHRKPGAVRGRRAKGLPHSASLDRSAEYRVGRG